MGMEGTISSRSKRIVHVVATRSVETTKDESTLQNLLPPVQPADIPGRSTLVWGAPYISASRDLGAETNLPQKHMFA